MRSHLTLVIFSILFTLGCKNTNFKSRPPGQPAELDPSQKASGDDLTQAPPVVPSTKNTQTPEPTLPTSSIDNTDIPTLDNYTINNPVNPPIIDPVAPRENCRAHFSGLLMSDREVFNTSSHIYYVDGASEYVGEGRYPYNTNAFPRSIAHTFDSVAIDAGTTVTIYSEPNFQGEILFQATGPLLLNNSLFEHQYQYSQYVTKKFVEPLQSEYPYESRVWSSSNMHLWDDGSTVIECE